MVGFFKSKKKLIKDKVSKNFKEDVSKVVIYLKINNVSLFMKK